MRITPPRCASLSRASGTPSKRCSVSSRPGPETMSPSDLSAITAWARTPPSRDCTSEKAASSSAPISRNPPCAWLPGTRAGLAPKNTGVTETPCPGATSTLRER